MNTKFKVQVFDGKTVKLFEGKNAGIISEVQSQFPNAPLYVISGLYNQADCLIEGGDEQWLGTDWEIKPHGIGNFNVTDPRGEKRFIGGSHPSELKGGVKPILKTITKFSSWEDFDQRAAKNEKEFSELGL